MLLTYNEATYHGAGSSKCEKGDADALRTLFAVFALVTTRSSVSVKTLIVGQSARLLSTGSTRSLVDAD